MLDLDRRNFLGLMGVAGAGVLLSGCVQDTPVPLPTSTLRAADPATAKGTVTYWNHFTGPAERAGFETVTGGFASEYPGLDLKVEALPYGDFMTKFTTAVQSGSTPDTAMVAAQSLPDMVAMRALTDISGPLASWEGSADIDPKLLAFYQQGDAVYAIPTVLYVDWIYYRLDWFEEAGIKGPPRTWAEFRSIAKKLTDPAKGRYGYGMRGGAGGSDPMYKLIAGYNGPLVDAGGAPTLDPAAVSKALTEFTDMYLVDKSVPPSAPADGRQQMIQAFLTGQTGMLIHATGSLQEIVAGLEPGVQVMTAPLPKAKFEMGQIQPLGNGLTSRNSPENALAWLEYWGSPAAQLDFLDTTGYIPAATSARSDSRMTSNPMLAAALEQIEIGVVPPTFRGLGGWLSTSVEVQVQAVLIGQTSVADATKAIVADFESRF